ncbi:hypothetical protein ACFSMW_19795 [Virgibacillus halophilus]|uniref:Uncharacterized protein n=1 Tax=Tigheibacillus halophilus TaxID=361280 RepID=A0ABU5C8Q6_9BACI|nr:hypothetical protein [Virgibacillus halophilus]
MNDEKQKHTAKSCKSYQETNEEIAHNEWLQKQQPTPQPKDMEEIDY